MHIDCFLARSTRKEQVQHADTASARCKPTHAAARSFRGVYVLALLLTVTLAVTMNGCTRRVKSKLHNALPVDMLTPSTEFTLGVFLESIFMYVVLRVVIAVRV